MVVRPLNPSDRDEYARMLVAMFPDIDVDEHLAMIDAYFTGTSYPSLMPSAVFVSDRGDGRLAGFLELSLRNYAEECAGWTPYVEAWWVDDDVRRQGVGRALMDAAEDWARGRDYPEMASDAVLDNEVSHRAHKAVGFAEVERVVHFRKPLG